jgi:hypothetical protein
MECKDCGSVHEISNSAYKNYLEMSLNLKYKINCSFKCRTAKIVAKCRLTTYTIGFRFFIILVF